MRRATETPNSAERLDLVRLTARLGALTAEALARHDGTSLASARGRLCAAERAGLLTSSRPLRETPALFIATAAGLRAAAVVGLEQSRIGPANARHAAACAEAAAELARVYPDHLVSGERELRRDERCYGAALASATLPPHAGGASLHCPDLVLWPRCGGSLPVAVEVELTVKAPRRLAQICLAWARCRRVAGVIYLVSPEAGPPVARAIEHAQARDRVSLIALSLLCGKHAAAEDLESAVADGP